MPHKKRTWIVVADGARARIFFNEGAQDRLQPVVGGDFANPDAHGFSRDLVSDKPGRTQESVGGARHAQEPKHDPHREAKRHFAREVGDYLEKAARESQFEQLFVAAPPPMLGDLRACLGRHATERVTREVPKDLTKIPVDHLLEHFFPERTA